MTRYALVPVEATKEMRQAIAQAWHGTTGLGGVCTAIISASPNAGKITAEMLERAAEALYGRYQGRVAEDDGVILDDWEDLHRSYQESWIADQRAAFEAVGLEIEGESP